MQQSGGSKPHPCPQCDQPLTLKPTQEKFGCPNCKGNWDAYTCDCTKKKKKKRKFFIHKEMDALIAKVGQDSFISVT